jgi:hypothetical protein
MHDRRQRRRPTPILPVVAVGLALLLAAAASLAACGSTLPATPLPSLPPATPAPPTEPVETFEVPSFEPETDAPEPTDTDTGSPGTPPCAVGELKASRGITEADADDRLTEVLLKSAATCSVDAFPTLVLRDSDGRVLVSAEAGGTGGTDLVGGVAYTSQVRLSNWCLGEPAYPATIGIVHGTATLLVTGDSFPDEGDSPPCVHGDADPVLTGTAWQPMP